MIFTTEIPPKKPNVTYKTRVRLLMVLLVLLMALALYVAINFATI